MLTDTISKKTHPLVMLVDDSAIDNFVNKRVMGRYEFAENVLEFSKARSALKYLISLNNNPEETIPSVLFLDLDMPEINGFEFLDAFNLLSSYIRNNMKIVILTSSISPDDMERCTKNKHVLTFVHKPLMKNNLDEIDRLVSKKNLKLLRY
jgi:CheY-like chemotaxis protein